MIPDWSLRARRNPAQFKSVMMKRLGFVNLFVHRAQVKYCVKHLKDVEGVVVDLGAGWGRMAKPLIGAGINVLGVENNAVLSEQYRQCVGQDAVMCGADKLPFANKSVSAFIVVSVFQYVPKASDEIVRCLKKNGLCIVIEPRRGYSPDVNSKFLFENKLIILDEREGILNTYRVWVKN